MSFPQLRGSGPFKTSTPAAVVDADVPMVLAGAAARPRSHALDGGAGDGGLLTFAVETNSAATTLPFIVRNTPNVMY